MKFGRAKMKTITMILFALFALTACTSHVATPVPADVIPPACVDAGPTATGELCPGGEVGLGKNADGQVWEQCETDAGVCRLDNPSPAK